MTNVNIKNKSAGLIIIGDELLKGHTKDENASFLLDKLWKNGIKVEKVSFIKDRVQEIANEVRIFSDKYDFVITAGGVGPTHDDLTYEGIALAFGESLVFNKEFQYTSLYIESKKQNNDTTLDNKTFLLPQSANLIFAIDPLTERPSKYPLVRVKNIYIFPGVPSYLQKLFLDNQSIFSNHIKFFLIKVYISIDEEAIKIALDNVNKQYPSVSVGSYPTLNKPFKVKVTLESEEKENLERAFKSLVGLLPEKAIFSVKKCLPNSRQSSHQSISLTTECTHQNTFPNELDDYLCKENTTSLADAIKCAWAVFKQTFDMYSSNQVCIGFNGGKDCTVVLHLILAYFNSIFPEQKQELIGLYFKDPNQFLEVQQFIEECETEYNFKLITLEEGIKAGLSKLKKSHPELKAIIMGTRRCDPFSSHLKALSMTDKGWPEFMRVLPLLDWSYGEVWQFLKKFNKPYCKLYDQGYTSLGSSKNTEKNPALLLPNGEYLSAYNLENEAYERLGRK
ncbi:FAD synthase isoform X2 [Hydra vulgaris]|uniref:FAD synthase n=1 Tax=Hydra vulgaris TaxID=6087 RepID=A0ABM4B6D6_HYDVU